MPELYRLVARCKDGEMEVILTDTHVDLEPSPEYRAHIEGALKQGREASHEAPKLIGWIVEKAVNFASRHVEKAWEPHPLADVDIKIKHDQISIKSGMIVYASDMKVDPAEAYIFDAKLREARESLKQ